MALRLRSALFAPANRPDMAPKMPRSNPDAVILDLEDGTPPAAKEEARAMATESATVLRDSDYAGLVLLRVNSPDTDLFAGDLRAYADGAFDGVVVPKTETATQVLGIEAQLTELGVPDRLIVWGLESVRGVVEAVPALGASQQGVAAYFGAEDYIADLGGRRTARGEETFYARTQVAMACRLAGMTALDQVVTALRDEKRFTDDAQFALDVGFGGKMCVHPAQVPVCNSLFTPSAEAVDRAQRLLACYEEALEAGRATADFEGQMIDGPLVAQARQVLSRGDDPPDPPMRARSQKSR